MGLHLKTEKLYRDNERSVLMGVINLIKVNKTEPKLNMRTDVKGDMEYYIEYAYKLYYPSRIIVGEDEECNCISVVSERITGSDEYLYTVIFDKKGKFSIGFSSYDARGYTEITDQNYFKQKIKKEINKINVIHGTTKSLLESMKL